MSACNTCAGSRGEGSGQPPLVQLGRGDHEYVVALAGNPNTGKSTVFNFLTGLRQHTGNWPGKTVTLAEGTVTHRGRRFKLVDLPGTYSLLADSIDEQIARDFILFGRPDCTIVVCDTTVLERNLNLALQILQITGRVVLCANLIDEARRKRIILDAEKLESELGVPVVPTAARHGRGLTLLMDRVEEVAAGRVPQRPLKVTFDQSLENAILDVETQLQAALPRLTCTRWIALRLLAEDEQVQAALTSGALEQLAAGITPALGASTTP